MEDQATAGGGGVDVFMQGSKFDAAVLQFGELIDEVPDGAAESVESPDHQGVAGAELVEEFVEFWSGLECTGGGVGEYSIAPGRGECIVLELCVLIPGGDSGVAVIFRS